MKQLPRSMNRPASVMMKGWISQKSMMKPWKAPNSQAERQHHRGRCERMPARRVEIRHDDADEADHRADRKIDAARQDHEGRADRGDDDEGVVGEHVAEHLRREEVVVEQPPVANSAMKTVIVARSGR